MLYFFQIEINQDSKVALKLFQLDSSLKEEVNKKAFSALEKATAAKQNSPSANKISSNATLKDGGRNIRVVSVL